MAGRGKKSAAKEDEPGLMEPPLSRTRSRKVPAKTDTDSYKNDGDWTEEDELKLFKLWKAEPNLYHTKHKQYRKKVPKQKSLEKMSKEMRKSSKY